jgi:hypothetical protein
VSSPPVRPSASLAGHVEGDLVEPTCQGFALPDGRCLAGEDEERRLEGVFGILGLVQHLSAHAQYQRPVPPHESVESGLVPSANERMEQLSVGTLLIV